MKRLFLLAVSFVVLFNTVTAQTSTPPSANDILKEAYITAAKENKKVMIIFHASWCVWCHRMDSSMNDPACKKFFDDHYVIRHLVVYESKGKENLENPGALDMLKQYKGADQGIPYWFIFDKDGNLLADSKIRPAGADMSAAGDNMGCPASKEEVEAFIDILRKTSSINKQQEKAIADRFRKNETH